MRIPSPELLVEVLSAVVYVVLAVALTVGGALTEYASLQYLGGGELTVALWMGAVGGVMLYAGAYGLGYQKVLGRFV